MIKNFDTGNFQDLCDLVCEKDAAFRLIIDRYGYPPLWKRKPDFPTLILIILEQQVSLASAKAAFDKLQQYIGVITPQKMLLLSDAELRACYFSRQKIVYARDLAVRIQNKLLKLSALTAMPDDMVRMQLKQVKGIGDWTADVYLMFVLQRPDCFPQGDIALIKAIKELKQLRSATPANEIVYMSAAWAPYRTIASFMLWHFYLRKRGIAH